jgi:hypothetical protein
MKPALYKGITYNVPEWAKWLAEDFDGGLYAYELKPSSSEGGWNAFNGGRWKFVAEIESETLVEIE